MRIGRNRCNSKGVQQGHRKGAIGRPMAWILGFVLCLSTVGLSVPVRVSALEFSLTLTVDNGVNPDDATLIEESVRFAQEYFREELGVTIDDGLHVSVRPGADPFNPGIVAFSMGRSLVFYTGASGWAQSAPVLKVETTIHEFVHFYQYLTIGQEVSVAWFDEGVAEYLAYTALDQRQLVDIPTVEAWSAWQLGLMKPTGSLGDYESPEGFSHLDWAGYPYAFLAISELMDGLGSEVIDDFYREIGLGASFRDAFTLVFGLAPEDFYRTFKHQLETLPGASTIPEDFAVIEGLPIASPVRVVESPETISSGEQMLIRALTVEAAVCTLTIQNEASVTLAERSTFADAGGDVFWLLTTPTGLSSGVASVEIDCGLEPARADLTIAS